MSEEGGMFTIEKHISSVNQQVVKNLGGKVGKPRVVFY